MKSRLVILVGCISCNLFSYGKTDSIPRHIYLKTIITDIRGQLYQGYLNAITDSAVEFTSDKSLTYTYPIGSPYVSRIAIPDIERISFKRRHSAIRGAGFGGWAGAAVGAMIGYSGYKEPLPYVWLDFGPGLDAFAGGFLGALSGGAIGLVIGLTAQKTFVINGEDEKYRLMQDNLHRRLTKKKTTR